MGNIFNKHKTLSVGLVIVVTPLVAKLFGWCLGKCKIALLPPAKIESEERNEVIFFPELAITGKNPAGYHWSNISKLLSIVREARHQLDMCLYLVTLPELANVVISLHQTGICVRLIVEGSNVGGLGCQVDRLRRSGVDVVTRNQTGLMHHKFIIVDGKILLSGSFNWTYQAVTHNNENVIVTSNPVIVNQFNHQFNLLLQECEKFSDTVSKRGDR